MAHQHGKIGETSRNRPAIVAIIEAVESLFSTNGGPIAELEPCPFSIAKPVLNRALVPWNLAQVMNRRLMQPITSGLSRALPPSQMSLQINSSYSSRSLFLIF